MTGTDERPFAAEVADMDARLRSIPEAWEQPPAHMIEKLPKISCTACSKASGKVCDRHEKKRCATCGSWITTAHVDLDYLGHAGVTRALIEIDPAWEWGLGWTDGDEHIDAFAMTNPTQPTVMLGTLTVLGVTRQCVGTVDRWKGPDTFKELIGDLLRNGAMRFGIGTALWSKADWDALPDSPAEEPAPALPEHVGENAIKNRLVQHVGGDRELAAGLWEGRPDTLRPGAEVGADDKGRPLFPVEAVEAWVATLVLPDGDDVAQKPAEGAGGAAEAQGA